MRNHLGSRVQVWLVAAIALLTSCAEREAKNVLEMDLAQPGTEQVISAELPVQFCMPGVVHAYEEAEESWRIELDEEGGGIEVAVVVTSPDGARLLGVLEEEEQLSPGFSGSGTAELRPEDDPSADPSTAQLAWLCD